MKVRRTKETSLAVIWSVFALMALGMALLVGELWKLQIPQQSGFVAEFVQQSVRRVRLPAIRGKIYDANGICLADSVPSYCIAIYTEELRAPRSIVANTLELLHEVWVRVGRPPDISYRDIQRHLLLTPEEPLRAWKQLTDDEMARWMQRYNRWAASGRDHRPKKIYGIDPDHPVEAGDIVLHTRELMRRSTTTAANTLELVYKLEERLGVPRQVSFQKIKDHIFARRPLPLLAWKNLDAETMARWADACADLAGADIYCQADRYYPEGENLAHLIGFTRSADPVSEIGNGERADFDMRGIEGKKGLEHLYNELLEGEAGSRLVQIDASGYHYRDLQTEASKPGGDIKLTIDARIQQFAKEALTLSLDSDPFEGPVKGAVVVLDPANGNVLAMVSSPLFDPNKYMRSSRYVTSLLTDGTNAPTLNRAIYGQYAPGSTFKPISALGVLREHPEYAKVRHDCPGYHMVGKRRMRCNAQHGRNLTLREALEHSCNVYMFKMSLEQGYEPIYRMAQDMGLGQVAGLFPNLEEEGGGVLARGNRYGNLPERAIGQAGVCNLSIGQGELIVAPLQMAMVATAIANGGHLYRPRLIDQFRFGPDEPYRTFPPTEIRRIDLPKEALDLVRGGMRDVVMSGREAAKAVQVGDIVIAGKTGTAEYGPKELGKKNTWMISFAPFEQPRYAIAFIVEDGQYGGTTVAPRLHALYKKLFEYDGTLTEEGSG